VAELVNVTALPGGTLHAASTRGMRDIAFTEFAAAAFDAAQRIRDRG
jgi:hypothetical protein